jgi:hypothetical protein
MKFERPQPARCRECHAFLEILYAEVDRERTAIKLSYACSLCGKNRETSTYQMSKWLHGWATLVTMPSHIDFLVWKLTTKQVETVSDLY